MFKPSGALTAQGLIDYHREDYANRQSSYYSEDGRVLGVWRGKLAEDFGLHGAIQPEHFERLAQGLHPFTGEVLIRHQTWKNQDSKIAEHRAGWDLMVAPPKSVSATALVGGDSRIIAAHRESVDRMLRELEHYIQVQLAAGRRENSENWIIALYEHDSSRPVDGKIAPQLHSHCVLFNMSRDGEGKIRSLDPRELFRIQSYGTALYRAELAHRLQRLGYELEYMDDHSFEIKGYSRDYLEAISPRRQEQILPTMKREGLKGRAVDKVVLSTREEKQDFSPEQVRLAHAEESRRYGHPEEKVTQSARERGPIPLPAKPSAQAHEAITFAKKRLIERTAVFDYYEVMRDALQHGLGKLNFADVETAFEERLMQKTAEFIEAKHHRTHAPGHRYTTPEMLRMERAILDRIHQSKNSVEPICESVSLSDLPELQDNLVRAKVLEGFLTTRDQFVALQGSAGAKKTTSLKILQPYIEQSGREMICLAPLGGAVGELEARGLPAETLQGFLTRRDPQEERMRPRYYVIDEASQISNEQLYQFLAHVKPQDRVLLSGDDSPQRKVGQHKSVGAGRIFYAVQQSGIKTAELNRMYRQKTPDMQRVARLFRDGQIEAGLSFLEQTHRIREVRNEVERYRALADEYTATEGKRYIIDPRNETRQILNAFTRERMQRAGQVGSDRLTGCILIPKDLRKEDTRHARFYAPGEVIQYPRSNRDVGVKAREQVEVVQSNVETNQITVRKADGAELTYDPKRVQGVQVFRVEERRFAVGERIQFTAPVPSRKLANRDSGTIVKLDRDGNAQIRLDKEQGRNVHLNLHRERQIEYAYAVTSHVAQGKTIARTIFHVACDDPCNRSLLGQDMTYTALTRQESDCVIYTDHKEDLVATLERECVKPTALSGEEIEAYRPPSMTQQTPSPVPVPAPAMARVVSTHFEGAFTGGPVPPEETPKADWRENDQAWREHLEECFLNAPEATWRNGFRSRPGSNETGRLPARTEGAIRAWPVPVHTKEQQVLLAMHEKAAQLYADHLTHDPLAQAYLAGRKISAESIREFCLGGSPREGHLLVPALQHYGPDLMRKSGLFVESETGEWRDRFRGRIMFPIQDTAGNVIAFAGRKLNEEALGPKYLNSPRTELYDKSVTLYNLHRVKEAPHLITVEGYFDAIAAQAAGVPAVAACGTAFTQAHTQQLTGRRVTINTDRDEAGQKAAYRQVGQMLAQGTIPRVAVLPRKDAAEVIEKDGADAYRCHIAQAQSVLCWLSEQIRKQHPGQDAYAKADTIRDMIAVLANVPPAAREEMDRQLSPYLNPEIIPEKHSEHQEERTVPLIDSKPVQEATRGEFSS